MHRPMTRTVQLGWLVAAFTALAGAPPACAQPTGPAQAGSVLPGTEPLEWEEADLSGRLMDGAHQFV